MGKFFLPVVLVFLVVISAGCVTFGDEQPAAITCEGDEKAVDGRCCFDTDDNGVCDIDEMECPESCDDEDACTTDSCSLATNFKCEHDAISPCCGNGECEDSEDKANVCPEDCVVIDMTNFHHRYSGPDYMDGDIFVFIHTGSNESDKKPDFYLNITAGTTVIKNIRATYNCTDSTTAHKIDSINADMVEVYPGFSNFGHENLLNDEEYTIESQFYSLAAKKSLVEVEELAAGTTTEFRLSTTKQQYKVRSKLTCDFSFYFLDPLKHISKRLEISYI